MTIAHIDAGVYLGDEDGLDLIDKSRFWLVDCRFIECPESDEFVPRRVLDMYSDQIQMGFNRNGHVYVFCHAGMERSPLVIAYHLVKRGLKKDLNEAFDYIAEKKPDIYRRTEWVENPETIQ